MKREPVASSNIRSIGFEDGVMRIEFANGRVYEYSGPNVERHHRELLAADSIGKHFAQHVRNDPETKARQL